MNILLAVDGSAQSERALKWVTTLAGCMEGGSVIVLSVAPTLEAAPPIADAVDPTSDIGEHRRQLNDAVAKLAAAGVEAELVLRAGNPANEILDLAESRSVDLIAIGHRGKGATLRFLMGSVSERVVRHASVPVLVVS